MKLLFPIICFTLVPSLACADCATPPPAELELQLKSCRKVDPAQETELLKRVARVLKDEEAKRVLAEYRGMLVTSASNEKFFFPTEVGDPCAQYTKPSPLRVLAASACCDGDPNPPCWLPGSPRRMIVKFLR